jgi:hypothetical protein
VKLLSKVISKELALACEKCLGPTDEKLPHAPALILIVISKWALFVRYHGLFIALCDDCMIVLKNRHEL